MAAVVLRLKWAYYRHENDSGNSGWDLSPGEKKAAEEGISLRQFVTEAIEARLQNEPDRHPKP